MEGYIETERPAGYPELTEELVYWCFCDWMSKKYGNKINQNKPYREAVQEMIYGILSAEEGELTVIPASMGVGKSTLLMVYAKYMAMNDPEFGCIIVKERIEDMDLLAEQLGYIDDEYEDEKICFAWKGFNPNSCLEGHKEYKRDICNECDNKICDIKAAIRGHFKHYPVVVISHERLFRLANTEDMLNKLKEWTDKDGNKHRRNYIFIDEQPKFFETYKENWAMFDVFITELNRVSQLANISIDTDMIKNIGGHLFYTIPDKEAMSSRDTRFRTKQEILNELNKIEKEWWKQSPESLSKLLPMLKDFFNNGGYRDGDKLTTFQYTDYTFKGFKTVVMDGTAKNELSYPAMSRMIDIEDFNRYENLTIHHYNGTNLSKTKLKRNPKKYLSMLIDDIKEISLSDKTLIVVSKDYRETLEELFHGIPNIEIAHFNSLKGTNKYRDCTAIFFAGTMDFGDEFYALKAFAIGKNDITSYKVEVTDMVRKFENEFINQVKLKTNVNYLLQDIFRTSIRRSDGVERQNHVYLFNTNEELIDLLISSLPGCKYEEWKPSQEFKSKAPTQSKVLELILSNLVYHGNAIEKKYICETLGIADKDLQRILRQPYIQQELNKRGITGAEPGNRSRILIKL